MEPLDRLSDLAPSDGESELKTLVESAQLERGRLAPDAVARVELRLGELDGSMGVWRSLRGPVYALAAAAVIVAVGARLWPAPVPIVVQAPVAPAPAPQLPPGTLRLDEGTLAVTSGAVAVQVQTPHARVEVAAHSNVRITIDGRAVKLSAESGSARVIYSDGRIELVAPLVPPPVAPAVSAHASGKHRGKPVVSAATVPVAAHEAVIAPAATPAHDGERASLNAALAQVRSAPEQALSALGEHLRRFPDGVLRLEAERARVALLLRQARRSDALSVLDRISALPTDLLVLRAELRAEAHRCEEAIGDFGAVLSADEDRFAERALFGRAMCRGDAGDPARMSEELDRYLARYPRGEYAERARNARNRR